MYFKTVTIIASFSSFSICSLDNGKGYSKEILNKYGINNTEEYIYNSSWSTDISRMNNVSAREIYEGVLLIKVKNSHFHNFSKDATEALPRPLHHVEIQTRAGIYSFSQVKDVDYWNEMVTPTNLRHTGIVFNFHQ